MTAAELQRQRPLTGWHVLAIFVGGFSIIIAVNLALAFSAVRTFPGTDRAAQQALGWTVEAKLTATALRLAVQDAGEAVVQPEIITATLGRATTVADDMTPAFAWDGHAWVAPVTAGAGNWNLRIEMRAADGTLFRRRISLRVTP